MNFSNNRGANNTDVTINTASIEIEYQVIGEPIQEIQFKINKGIQMKLKTKMMQQQTLSISVWNVTVTKEVQKENDDAWLEDRPIDDSGCNMKGCENNKKKTNRGVKARTRWKRKQNKKEMKLKENIIQKGENK